MLKQKLKNLDNLGSWSSYNELSTYKKSPQMDANPQAVKLKDKVLQYWQLENKSQFHYTKMIYLVSYIENKYGADHLPTTTFVQLPN
jgi:hypothetical protein